MRSILLHVCDDDDFEARFQAALDLARAFDARITCIQPILISWVVPGDIYGMNSAELVPVLRENAAKFQSAIEGRLADEGVAWRWIQEMDVAGNMLLAHAALSDLILVGTSDAGGGDRLSMLPGHLALHAQAPVLAVPAISRGFDPAVPAIVAWNGSPQASHALRSAVPLLARAASVTLIAVQEERAARGYDLPSTEGAEYLARHGIECELVAMPPLEGSAPDALRQAIEARKAGYMVMGAYGHWRLRELIFGGMTRAFLRDLPAPLFLGH